MRESPLLELVRPYPALRAVLQRLEAADKVSPSSSHTRRAWSPSSCDRRISPLSRIRSHREVTPSKSPLRQDATRRASPACIQGDFRAARTCFPVSAQASPSQPYFAQCSPLRSLPPNSNTLFRVRASQAARNASPLTFCRQGVSSSHSSRCATPRHHQHAKVEVAEGNFQNLTQCPTPRQVQCRLPPPPDWLVDGFCSAPNAWVLSDRRDTFEFISNRRIGSKPCVPKTCTRARSLSLQASEPYEDRDIKSWPVSNSFIYGRHGELMGSRLGLERPRTPRNQVPARPPSGHIHDGVQRRSRSLQASEPFSERCGSPSTDAHFMRSLRDGRDSPRVPTRSNSGSPVSSSRSCKMVRPCSANARVHASDDMRRYSRDSPRLSLYRPCITLSSPREPLGIPALDVNIEDFYPLLIRIGRSANQHDSLRATR